jgi:hypothetical protein
MDACDECRGAWWHVERHILDSFLAAGYELPHQHEDALHDHTEIHQAVPLTPWLSIAVQDGGLSYCRDYYEDRPAVQSDRQGVTSNG